MARFYLNTVSILLVFTAVAKFYSVFGHNHAKLLLMTDPLFGMHFQTLLIMAALLELVVAGTCVFSRSSQHALYAVAWLSGMFLSYRVGLNVVHWQKPCPCLGNFSDALHIAPATADDAMRLVLAYFLLGSVGMLFFQGWKDRKRAAGE